MRILAITNLFPTTNDKIGGIFTARQFEMLAQLGADITIVFTIIWIPDFLQRTSLKYKDYNKRHTPLQCPGVNVITVPYVRWTRSMAGYRWDGLCIYHSAKKMIHRMHSAKHFDVLYGKGIFPSSDAAVRFARFLNIPAVGEGIGDDVNTAPDYSPGMYRHFLRTARGLNGAVADGKGVAERLSSAMNADIPTIHGLVDIEKFHPVDDKTVLRQQCNVPQDSLVFLFAGYLVKEKGVHELIEAFSRLQDQHPGVILIMCGNGAEYQKLLKTISERNLTNSVFLTGAVDPAAMHRWLQMSDLFVLPTYNEGMPNVVMEAMACGLPVISTNVGGLPEAVGSCGGAVLIEPKNIEQLVSAMAQLAGDSEKRKLMGRVARQTAERKFGARTNAEKLLAYLGTVIDHYKNQAHMV